MLAEIIAKVAGFEKRENGPYYPRPSMAGPERCIRQMVYQASGTPKDKSMADRFIMVLDDSSWHAYLVIDWLNKSAFRVHSQEMEVETDGLKGHIDGVVTDMLGNDRLLELKALNHFSFERYYKGSWPLDYITQTSIYIKGLQKVIPDISEGILLIKNKNTSQFLEMLIRYDKGTDTSTILEVSHSNGDKKSGELLVIPDIIKTAMAKFEMVDIYAKSGTFPERPFEIGTTFPCGYCGHEDTCWKDYEKEYEALSTSAELSEEWITKAKYYLELGMHIKEMEKERDGIKNEIKSALKKVNASKATVGEYIIHNQLQESSSLNKELIPIDILKKATKKGFKEVLSIRKPKEVK